MTNLNIGIIGLGLIGGSLAKSLHLHHPDIKIIGYDINVESLITAKNSGVLTEYSLDIDDSFSNCHVIFLCLPVKSNIDAMNALKPHIKPTCILTDVGSTKSDIIDWTQEHLEANQFIGGHPMTGSERSGYDAAQNYLFENAYYILCPTNETPFDSLELLKQIIRSIGAIPVVLDATKHDEITACISHVPHILASLLVNTVRSKDSEKKHMHMLAAGGFRDITRIASSSPEMWQHISLSNKKQIDALLEFLQDGISHLRKELLAENQDAIYHFFETAKKYRDSFEERSLNPMFTTYELRLDVEDKPGMIARVSTLLSQHELNIKNIGILNNREHEQGILEITFYDEPSRDESAKLLRSYAYTVYF